MFHIEDIEPEFFLPEKAKLKWFRLIYARNTHIYKYRIQNKGVSSAGFEFFVYHFYNFGPAKVLSNRKQ